jgi:nitroreductase
MDFKTIVHSRYATKQFSGQKIPEDKIEQLLELMRYAPSSFNIQPWAFKVISDSSLKQRLLPVSMNQAQITSCSHLFVLCADTRISHNIDRLEKLFSTMNVKTESYISLMRGFEKSMNDAQKLAWAQRQVYLALGNAVNGAKALGFDSCPMEGFDPKSYSEILNLPPYLIPTALCALGYAADSPSPKLRFPLNEIVLK